MTEQLLMTTVRIECVYPNGGTGTGTGFFFNLLDTDDDKKCPVLITNKHVVAGATSGRLTLPFKLGSHGPELKGRYTIDIANFQKPWVPHPDDQVDLCAMPIAQLYSAMVAEKKEPYIKCLGIDLIPNQEFLTGLTAIEDVVMIGYPIGLWDAKNNLPIVRRGTTATHPGVNYNGKKEFMIDAACFPGSSGSPVLLYNVGGYFDGSGMTLGTRIKLLGVLYAVPIHTVNGKIEVRTIPTANVAYLNVGIPVNLGYVINATQILEFKPIFEKLLANNSKTSEKDS